MITIYKVAEGAVASHPFAVREVASQLKSGALALLPTETVYGVGVAVGAYQSCNEIPELTTGYGRIFTLKQREITQTVPWLVDGPVALDVYGCDIDAGTRALAEALWPGALTLIVKAAPCVPTFMQAADGTVALRASASPVIQALVKACGSPLAVTSANTHGAPAPASFQNVEPRILQGVDVAIDAGATPCHDASTIVSLTQGKPRIIRQGALPAEAIYKVLS